jgi:hypothetical protein
LLEGKIVAIDIETEASEIRIFPLLKLDGEISSYLKLMMKDLSNKGYRCVPDASSNEFSLSSALTRSRSDALSLPIFLR